MPLPGFSLPSSIAVIGAGHVGVPHAVMLAKKCPEVRVTIFDDDLHKIAAWNSPLLPFYEPGLQECLAGLSNISFSSDLAQVVEQADIILVSVSTPLKTGVCPAASRARAGARAHPPHSRGPR
jgi:UDPglucose 6-dehydrogenase